MKSLCVCVCVIHWPVGLWPPCWLWSAADWVRAEVLRCKRQDQQRAGRRWGPWGGICDPRHCHLRTHTDIYKHTVNIQTYFHSFHKIEVHSVCSSVVLPASHRCSSVFRADLSSILQAPPLFSCRLIGDVSTNFRAWRTACSTRPRPAVSPGPGSRNVYLFAGYYKKNKNVFVCVCVLPVCVLGWWTTSLRTPSNR